MTWEGYPLHFIAKHGWGFLVPKDGDWVNNEHETDTSTLDDENNIDTEGTDEGSEDQKQFPVRYVPFMCFSNRSSGTQIKIEIISHKLAKSLIPQKKFNKLLMIQVTFTRRKRRFSPELISNFCEVIIIH